MTPTIYVGDTFPLVIEWTIPSPENPYQSTDAVISTATVKVIHNKRRTIVVNEETADVVGNETRYTIPSDANSRAGAYTAYVTVTFNDDTRITKRLEYFVSPKN